MRNSAIPATWRAPLTLVALFAIGFTAIFGYSRATRTTTAGTTTGGSIPVQQQAPSRPIVVADAEPPQQRSNSDAEGVSPATAAEKKPGSPQAIPEETLQKLIADVTAYDARKRSAAISALSKVPKDKAVPTLRNLLTSGDPKTDRPLALRSLRVLALKQGDADGAIRDVLRQATYHADDEATVSGAQEAISDIERVMSAATSDAGQ